MASNSFTVGGALKYSWETFKKNWQFLILTFFIVVALNMLPNYLHDWARENIPSISFVFSIVGILIQMVVSIGIIILSLKIVDGKKPEILDLFKHYNLILNYFLGSLLYGLVIVAGLILLIVPGIIWGIKYQYTTYLIVDKKMGPVEAFKKSGKITQGSKMKLFYLGLVFVGLVLAGMLLFGLGLILVWPIVSLASAYVYRKLSATTK